MLVMLYVTVHIYLGLLHRCYRDIKYPCVLLIKHNTYISVIVMHLFALYLNAKYILHISKKSKNIYIIRFLPHFKLCPQRDNFVVFITLEDSQLPICCRLGSEMIVSKAVSPSKSIVYVHFNNFK